MEIERKAKLKQTGDIVLITKNEKGKSVINLSAVQRTINKNLKRNIEEIKEENEKLKKEINNIKNILENHNLRIDEERF